jgi:putative ABC transport system ATP-binding protein
MATILECISIRHRFGHPNCTEEVLSDINLSFRAGETCVLMGPSGSGKTTLLSILGCMLTPTSGRLLLGGREVDYRFPRLFPGIRRQQISFVFQHSQLLPFLTVQENLEIVGRNAGMRGFTIRGRIDYLLHRLGISPFRHKKPHALSGGQRQRAAIARAALHRPPILLADEPTAALDWHYGQEAVRLLIEQAQLDDSFLLMVTHDTRLVPYFQQELMISEGRIEHKVSARVPCQQ